MIFSLAHNSNLHHWKIPNKPNCNLCDGKQAQLHALNNCPTAATEEQYTLGHDSVLYMLAPYLTTLENVNFHLYAKLEGYKTTGTFFISSKPDNVLIKNNCMYITELIICLEKKVDNTKFRDM